MKRILPLTKPQLEKLLNSISKNNGAGRGICSAHITAGGSYSDLPERFKTERTGDIFDIYNSFFRGATT